MTEIVNVKEKKVLLALSPKAYLNTFIFDDVKNIKRGKKKILEKDFIIPEYNEYENVISKNYNVSQLKKILKYYKLKISGNKQEKISRIYNNLKYSYYAIKIQKIFRKNIIKNLIQSKGKGLFNRNICVNEWDPLTLEPLTDINFDNYISIEESGKTYGFNIASFYNLWKRKALDKNTIINPFSRNSISRRYWENCLYIIYVSKKINRNVIIQREEDEILSIIKKIEMRTTSLFQKIDELGYITDINWFMNLSRLRLGRFVKELKEIWSYRLQIPQEIKNQICPPNGMPFIGIHLLDILHLSKENLRKKCLKVMENLISGNDHDSKHVGATYILGALTLVSGAAANSMPWLFQSFMYNVGGPPTPPPNTQV